MSLNMHYVEMAFCILMVYVGMALHNVVNEENKAQVLLFMYWGGQIGIDSVDLDGTVFSMQSKWGGGLDWGLADFDFSHM